MKCHLCLEERKLIKSHGIPKSFFLPLRPGKRIPKIYSNTPGVYPKKSPIGIYDKSILCSECDNLIGKWDNYAQQLLLKDFTEDLAVLHGTDKVAYKIDSFNYHKLKLFFVSVLWRASISKHYFYKRIRLGPYQSIARKMIIENDPSSAKTFSVVISKFSDPKFTGILDPHLDRIDGIKFYRFYMTGFVVYIKVDKRNIPDFMKKFYIREGHPLWVILRDLHKSNDLQIMKQIAVNSLR